MLPRWLLPVMGQELKQAFSYRADFWIQFFAVVFSQFLVAYFLWKSVFLMQSETHIGGFTFEALMLYYMLAPLVDRCVRGFDNFQLSAEIYDGSLNRYLIYPIPFFAYRYASYFGKLGMALFQLFVGVLLYFLVFGFPSEINFSIQGILQALILGLGSGVVMFLMGSILEMVAFWADNVWSLMVMLRMLVSLVGGALVPLEMFPQLVRDVLDWTVFPYVVSVPVRLIMGIAGWADFQKGMLVIFVWGIGLYFVARLVWRKGLLKYSGVGI